MPHLALGFGGLLLVGIADALDGGVVVKDASIVLGFKLPAHMIGATTTDGGFGGRSRRCHASIAAAGASTVLWPTIGSLQLPLLLLWGHWMAMKAAI